MPRPSPNPRSPGCNACGLPFAPEWLSSDETLAEFFSRLQEAAFPGEAPHDFLAFRAHCEARERAGRESFGLAYLSRDNLREAMEEFADGANYFFFDTLQHLRNRGDDDDYELALTAALHAYKAHRAARELAAKRRGSP